MKNAEEPEDGFHDFADTMLELVKSFKEVMKTEDPDTKLLAIEMLGELKETMGETFQQLMEEYDIYPSDLEKLMQDQEGKCELTETLHSVADEIQDINKEVLPEIEKTLEEAGIKKKKRKKNLKKGMIKRLKSND